MSRFMRTKRAPELSLDLQGLLLGGSGSVNSWLSSNYLLCIYLMCIRWAIERGQPRPFSSPVEPRAILQSIYFVPGYLGFAGSHEASTGKSKSSSIRARIKSS